MFHQLTMNCHDNDLSIVTINNEYIMIKDSNSSKSAKKGNMAEDLPQIMTIEEASKYLRILLSSLYKLAQGAKIPCQKVGRHWRFHQATLKEWLAGKKPFPKYHEDINET